MTLRWTAGPDGVAHAHADHRTACHVPPIAERWAWPETSRCPACLRVLHPEPVPIGRRDHDAPGDAA